jgi:hypothetical protein
MIGYVALERSHGAPFQVRHVQSHHPSQRPFMLNTFDGQSLENGHCLCCIASTLDDLYLFGRGFQLGE